MDRAEIEAILEVELASLGPFQNLHGIRLSNVRTFSVPPSAVLVDPDDLETQARSMWVVLKERSASEGGYQIPYMDSPGTQGN
jgi:hypothetical protein